MKMYQSPLIEVNEIESTLSLMNVSGSVGNTKLGGIENTHQSNTWETAR